MKHLSADRLLWFLKTTHLFQGENTSVIGELANSLERHSWAKGLELPIFEGAKPLVHLVVEGSIRLIAEEKATLELLGPGDLLGGSQVLSSVVGDRVACSTTAHALTPCVTLLLGADDFTEILKKSPTVLINFVSQLEQSRRRLEVRLTNLLFRTSVGKVAGILLELASRFGEPGKSPQSVTITVPITHQDISSLVGLRRESVSLALASLELEELIQYKRNELTILNSAKLAEIK
ncbi:MAG: Crp/Fnr family transcriptional regulator [Candidatus Sumerlaeia bacterium]|nr:Crp/Fnr family transcriptional regulator [Candidatus Sumerlaeia bacterium]